MAEVTIDGLAAVTAAQGGDFLPLWQGADTKKISLANLLANVGVYSVGTWTPQLQFGGANVGMTGTFGGRYVRIGGLVWIEGSVALTAKGTSTGLATLGALPFAPDGTHGMPLTFWFANMTTAQIHLSGRFVSGRISIFGVAATTPTLYQLSDPVFANNTQLRFGGQYFTSDAFAMQQDEPPTDVEVVLALKDAGLREKKAGVLAGDVAG